MRTILTCLPKHTMTKNPPPAGFRHLTNVEIAKLLTLDKNGWKQQATADELSCSQSTVQRTFSKYNYNTFITHQQHPGQPHKTTKEDERHLIVIAKCNYNKPLSDIINLSGLNISIMTMIR